MRRGHFTSTFFTALSILISAACSNVKHENKVRLFTLLPADSTGIDFNNVVTEDENINPLQYENSYNGGGVAIGDLNNDGLDDVVFSSNTKGNRLYLNKGNFKFQDVTAASGIAGRISWNTGLTMADVNGDGFLDVYACHSGNLSGKQRMNELFINNGVNRNGIPTFAERASEFGLADSAFSNQAAFFDYDADGDLDMILLNHSPVRFNHLDETTINYLMNKTDSLTGLKLYRNEKGVFKDITLTSGIRNARLNFNLGVSVADMNNDGRPDIYVSNDYLAPDCLYINNGNGTFTDELEQRLAATSEFSMGLDVADINNDGNADIYTLDMLPEDNRRQKLLFSSDNFEFFEMNVKAGLHKQYMRNMLHLNNGDGSFSEIGQLARVSNTDWSWSALLADFDNDGWKDIFVSNGYLRDYTNMDFLKFMGDFLRDNQGRVEKERLLELVKKMPASDVKNYGFRNNANLTFTDKSADWGVDGISNSSGAAYADLDNDGDLDLVVNNINKPAFVYRNNADQQAGTGFIRVKLAGEDMNRFGVGAKVKLFIKNLTLVQEQLMTRGFESSVSPVLVFGTGNVPTIDSLVVTWHGKTQQVIKHIKTRQEITLKESDATSPVEPVNGHGQPLFSLMQPSPVNWTHYQESVNDFKRQPLLIHSLSYNGPCMATGDVNGDGREDLFIGGSPGHPAGLFVQNENQTFTRVNDPCLEADATSEDASAVIFDANGDGKADLFVAAGGYGIFEPNAPAFQPRLYINGGNGKFSRAVNAVPAIFSSIGPVVAGDLNGDGFTDLFLGGRCIPGRYPEAPASYILLNNGKGIFRDGTKDVCPEIAHAGMFTSAVFADLNGDDRKELITAGEWLPIQVWTAHNGKLEDNTSDFMETSPTGWWSAVQVRDVNGDKKPDIIAGNYGLNCQWRASGKEPVEMLYNDFDENGAVDPIFCYYIHGKTYPYVSRDELLEQMSIMRTRFPDYKSYADADVSAIFSSEELHEVKKLAATSLETSVWLSNTTGKWIQRKLPVQAQFSPVYAIAVNDFNKDGKMDILLGGNTTNARIKIGSNESNEGALFAGDGKGGFQYIPQPICGLKLKGETRSFCVLNHLLLAGLNGQPMQAYRFNE